MKYRDCLKDVLPYKPGMSENELKNMYGLDKVIKIASNENPYGASKLVREYLNNIDYNIYPDNYVTELRQELADELDIKENMLLFGNGSVEIIQMLSRVLLEKGSNIISELPSFSSYFSEAKIQDTQIKTISYNNEFSFNLNEMLGLIDENTKIIYITNPNNPLGTIITGREIDEFLNSVPQDVLVVIDEAYFEFVRDKDYVSGIEFTKKYNNVCVLRTFSKAYGLAALRIGYIVAYPELINELEKVRVPFNVSTISQRAARIALRDKEHLKIVIENTHETIEYMYKELDKRNIEYIKTQANFIMINLNRKSGEVLKSLLKRGYIARDGFPLMDTWMRVSVGKKDEMEGFIKALIEVIK